MPIALLCLLMVSSVTYAQEDRIAEIEQRLRTLDSEVRTKAFTLEPEIEALLSESIELGSTRNAIMANLILAKAHETQKDYAAAYASIDSAFAIAERNEYRKLDYMLYNRKGFILVQQGENTEAIEYLRKSADIADEAGNERAKAQALLHIGFAMTKNGDLSEALKLFDEARVIYQEADDQYGFQRLHEMMGLYYVRAGDMEKAIEEYKKALEKATEMRDTSYMITAHLNILSKYAVRGDVEQALYHYEERNKLIEQIEFPEDRKIDLNIGVLYVQTEQYQKALDVLDKCSEYYQKEGNAYRVALIDHWKALAYRGLNRYDLAAQYSEAAFNNASESGSKKLAELSAYTLFQTYHWRGRDTEAIDWLITSNEIKDSINSEEMQKEMLALETRYETFRKEQEIETLKAQAESERAKRNLLIGGLLASIVIAGTIIYSQISRRKQEQAIEAAKLKAAILEQEKLEERLHHKEKELATQLLNMAQKNEFLANVNDSLTNIKQAAANEEKLKLQKVIRTINRDMESNETWEKFLESFKEVHHSFTEMLVNQYQLSANELRLATMMKMNMNSKEIASLLNISLEGVKKARYRLRKKLGLESDVNIQEYLLALG